MKQIFYILTFILCIIEVKAAGIMLSDTTEAYRISNGYAEVYKDKSNKLTIKEISSPLYSNKFQSLSVAGTSLSEPGTHYWVRINIKNNSYNTKHWVLELYDFRINEVEMYMPDKKFYNKSGYAVSFDKRTFKHKNFVYNLDIPTGEERIYYAKLIPGNATSFIDGQVRSFEVFNAYAIKEYFILALFYGLILTLICYNLLMYLSIRDKSYLYYVLYILSMGLLGMARDGIGFHYLWPDFPAVNEFIFPVSELCMILFAGLYARHFLKLKENIPVLHKAIAFILLIRIALFLTGVIFYPRLLYMQWYDIIPFTIIFIAGIWAGKLKYQPARYYIIAFSILFASFIVNILMDLHLIPVKFFTFYSMNFGVMGEIIFLSFALADKLKTIMKEKEDVKNKIIAQLKENESLKEKVNRELEEKVNERTMELRARTDELLFANEKLQKLTAKLNEMNAKLDLDNWNLNKEVKEKTKAMIFAEDINYEEFSKVFPDDLSCLRHLEEIKWHGGYTCRKCGNENYSEAEKKFSRKCTRCDYIESPTAYTLFHGIKFPLSKAFYLVYTTAISKNKNTLKMLSEALSLRMNACSEFRKKVEERKIQVMNKTGKKEIGTWEQLILDQL
ncbi:MAG: hypothetical protein K2X86_00640 [Cytophagaceae bacterium]|nr:hypothetical protein [Cytophagaceae bacterium]